MVKLPDTEIGWLWNSLSKEVVEAQLLRTFKTRENKVLEGAKLWHGLDDLIRLFHL